MNHLHIMLLFILSILFIYTISQHVYTITMSTPHHNITITTSILDYLLDIKHYMTTLIITNPMKNLYLNGPKSLFCWGGAELSDICAKITGSSSDFWNKNIPECITIIEKQFNSYYIMLTTILYVILIYKVVTILWWRFFIMRPMMNQMNTILEPLLTLSNKG